MIATPRGAQCNRQCDIYASTRRKEGTNSMAQFDVNKELPQTPAELYRDLMKRVLSNVVYGRVVPETFDSSQRESVRLEGGA